MPLLKMRMPAANAKSLPKTSPTLSSAKLIRYSVWLMPSSCGAQRGELRLRARRRCQRRALQKLDLPSNDAKNRRVQAVLVHLSA
jgi:hypothetical protein